MTSTAPFKVFPDRIDREDYEEGLKRISQALRPAWEHNKIKFKEFKDGVIHRVICCYHGDEGTMGDAMVFRIFPDDNLYLYIEGDEHKIAFNQQIANITGTGPQLIATFENGTVSSYIKGTTMKNSDFKDIAVIRQITDHIAKLHLVDLDQDFFDFYGKQVKYKPKFEFVDVMKEFMKYVPQTCRDPEKRVL